ncbi:hypothetical protein [Tenacibaculum retecalamus]|uniref:hypothetical protein n=1 Tax=Tenacibaculum retecalamus TaxID=3018315 RepID=UPI0023D8E2A2|nr:hypothetical protein [Tenacibaculum retecalamus]WBX72082.1 hypothetical protein PG912_04760 [Tenacibaculum retecalamus]
MFLEKTTLVDNKQSKILEFPKINVLEHKIEQVNEFIRQRKVFFLRNLNKEKFEIFFTDHTGLKRVEASIWTVSEKAIILKNTTVVPFSDIVAVA